MSEHISPDPSHKESVLRIDKLGAKSPFVEFKYTAKDKGPTAAIDYMRGMPQWSFNMFVNTDFQVEIPYRGYATTDKALRELDELTLDTVQTEPFNLLYRHMYMLQHMGSPGVVAKFVPTIMERVGTETNAFAEAVYPNDAKKREITKEYVYLASIGCLEVYEEDPSIRLPQKYVRQLYHDSVKEHPLSWRYALVFDKRNKMYGDSIDIEGHFKILLTERLLDPEKTQSDESKILLESSSADPEFQTNLLTYSLLQTNSNEQIISIIQQMAPVMGVEKIRKTLREYVEDNPSFREKFDLVFDYLGFDPTKAQVSLARDIYEKIDFSEYEPNKEMQEFEIEFLKKELSGCSQVLDVACGMGRHLEALDGQKGLHVVGIDIVKKHIDHIKGKNPQSDVRVASWFSMPFPDRTFDAAYCLGRSFTHNTTIPDAVMCLGEMGRVIKDDGFVILDLPDPNVGEYKDKIEKTKKIVEEKGLKSILTGTIIDSPDMQHYFDRYAPTAEAFEAITELAGFRVEKLTTASYRGVSGDTNINEYWKLTKETKPNRLYNHWSGSISDKRPNLIRKIKE